MYSKYVSKLILITGLFITFVYGQYDHGEVRRGENRGDLSPGEIATITIISITVLIGLCVTLFFCYYVHRHSKKSPARYAIQDQMAFS